MRKDTLPLISEQLSVSYPKKCNLIYIFIPFQANYSNYTQFKNLLNRYDIDTFVLL